MKRTFLILCLVIVAGIGMFLADGNGSLVMNYADWTMQVQLWVVILGLLVLILVISALVGSYSAIKKLCKHTCLYFKTRKEKKLAEKEEAKRQALQKMHQSMDLGEIKKHWQQLSHRLRHDPEFSRVYVENVLRFGGDQTAVDVVEKQLNHHWQPELVEYYGLLPQNAGSRLKQMDHWLAHRPHDAALLLSAGRVAMSAQMWGKAEQYLQKSIAQKPSVEAYLELAEVQQQLGKTELAWRSYQAARQQLREVKIL